MAQETPPLSALLRRLRDREGLSLSATAKAAGLSKGHLHELESGRTTNPTLSMLVGLATYYAVSPVTLFKAALKERGK